MGLWGKKRLCLLFFSVTALAAVLYAAHDNEIKSGVVINELCGRNVSLVGDAHGDFGDYVELYNPSDREVGLDGYALAKGAHKRRDTLPALVVPAHGYLLLFANGGTEENELPFRLSEGETLSLYRADGKLLDTATLPVLPDDMSYGRTGAKEEALAFAAQAGTPGEENRYVFPPVFSHASGYYDEPFSLALTQAVPQEGVSIYYTLSCETPDTASTLYDAPFAVTDASTGANVYSANEEISPGYMLDTLLTYSTDVLPPYYELPKSPVDKCTVVRAVAIDRDGNRSEEAAGSFFVIMEKGF